MWDKRFEVFYVGSVRDGGWYVRFRESRIPSSEISGPFKTANAAVCSVEFQGYPVWVNSEE